MKNYYEILEVSENASSEVIEKAYKALVKKYHPDLQPTEKKQEAENKIKIINKAYDILSNQQKKENYDKQLKMQKMKEEQLKFDSMKKNTGNDVHSSKNNHSQSNTQNHNPNSTMQKRVIKNPLNITSNDYDDFDRQEEYNRVINEAYNNAYNNAYNEAYINSLKNMGYQIKYERPFKEKIRTFFAAVLAILFLIVVFFILWHIPFVRNYLIDLYNSNDIIRILVDIVKNIWSSFISLFSDKV